MGRGHPRAMKDIDVDAGGGVTQKRAKSAGCCCRGDRAAMAMKSGKDRTGRTGEGKGRAIMVARRLSREGNGNLTYH